MKTKKQYKRRNKVGLKGGASDSDSEAKPTPSYMKYNLIMLGLSGAYIFLKLTRA